MPVQLIADDAGATPGIDAAIEDLISAKVLDGVAVFANLGGLRRCLAWRYQDVAVGIHLNLSTGPPVLPPEKVRSLLGPSGNFSDPRDLPGLDPAELLQQYRLEQEGHIDPDELIEEFRAQTAAFHAVVGRQPDFVSVHHDLDDLEVVRAAADAAAPNEMCRRTRLEQGELEAYEYKLHPSGASVEEIAEYFGGRLDTIDPQAQAEIICHPAASEAGLEAMTIYRGQRVQEYRALLTKRVRKALVRARPVP